jgi:transposase InsO family protein
MFWKKMSVMVRRLEFVKLALRGQQNMSQLCRRYRISRKTGYKWKARFEEDGQRGLRDRSRRPHRSPQQVAWKWVQRIRRLRRRHRSWGSKKLHARLRQQYPRQELPSIRTMANWLSRMKLTRRRRRSPKGPRLSPTGLTAAQRSNDVWTVDFKGWFRTADGQRVEPLTVRDLFSRYLLLVRVLPDQSWRPVRRLFLSLFRRYGYPKAIRIDNGGPFASRGPAGLSRLSAWWTTLGIRVEFIAPGHPEQNAGHEQMHRVLKAETTRPPSSNPAAQQRRINRWRAIYNHVRPHEGLKQRSPARIYRPQRSAVRTTQLRYPRRWLVRRVRSNGQIRWQGRKRFLGEALVGYPVGLRKCGAGKWAVHFTKLLMGELWESDQGGIRPSVYARKSSRRSR